MNRVDGEARDYFLAKVPMKHFTPPQLVEVENLGRMLLENERQLNTLPNTFANMAIAEECVDESKVLAKKLVLFVTESLRE